MMGQIRVALDGSLVKLAVRPVLVEGCGGSFFLRIAIDQREDVPGGFKPLVALGARPFGAGVRKRFEQAVKEGVEAVRREPLGRRAGFAGKFASLPGGPEGLSGPLY